ncbi:hypothetical protein ACHAXR_005009, partial [Thalassiosira sp. AJA248-18]
MASEEDDQAARHNAIRDLMEKCQAHAVETSHGSHGSLVKTLQSLHRALVATRMQSPRRREPNLDQANAERSQATLQIQESLISTVATTDDSAPSSEQEFLHNVAKELINLDRVIFLVDEEVNAELSPDGFDYENDCKWYIDAMEILSRVGEGCKTGGCDAKMNTSVLTTTVDGAESTTPSCDNPERWIDRCLDICGYATSLELAVDCLRRIVHDLSTSSTPTTSSYGHGLRRGDKRPGLAPAITSLRTIRRRLILLPPSISDEDNLMHFPGPYRGLLLRLKDDQGLQRTCQFCECIILPLEYHHLERQTHQHQLHGQTPMQQNVNQIHSDHQLLSESLSSLAVSVLPTLVASACHAIDLPLPSWAKPKVSYGILINSAWKILLAGHILGNCLTSSRFNINASNPTKSNGSPTEQSAINAAASNHFKLLLRQMIESGRSEIVVHQIYHCWKSCDVGKPSTTLHDLKTPRSILCSQLQSTLASIPSKREVALFSRSILRYCTKQHMPKSVPNNYLSQQARDQLEEICANGILPFIRDVLLQSLSKDEELAEAMVNYVILSPPTSFHCQSESSLQSYPTLHFIDRAVPRCLSQLLTETSPDNGAVNGVTQSCETPSQEDSDSEDQAESHNESKVVNPFIAQLSTVASVWSEDIFITRTDALQQQYVTEFLLHPLESKQLTPTDLQKVLSDDGIPLATSLVQGVTFRLDVSRSESTRIDGMRVAEAMASILGQTLRFDELHPTADDDVGVADKEDEGMEGKKKERRRKRKPRVRVEPGVSMVVDPDAEYFTDDSDSSYNSSQSDSSTDSSGSDGSSDSNSSWGEDSLVAYPMNDDEEDLRRVARPCTLRDCLAYLLTSDKDDLAYDKLQSALTELATIVASQPLDLLDVVSTLVRVLLFLEDKFNIDHFSTKRWNSLIALSAHAPLETTTLLVEEMRGNISLGTRLEALSILSIVAQELSGIKKDPRRTENSNCCDEEVTSCSTKLQRVLNLRDESNVRDAKTDLSAQSPKTRRWRQPRTSPTTTTNRFGSVSVQMIYSLFAFLSQTRNDESIWGGPFGERFLSEFLKTLSIMLYCASTYPNSAL